MSTSSQNKALVAVIDDDDAARMSVGQMLHLRGFRTELFSSAENALAWPGLNEADCVVTDVKMPGMDGEAFLAEAIRRELPAPVVMITGHGDVTMAVRCLKAGAYDFLEKPFDDDLMLACVRRAVEKTAYLRERCELQRRLQLLPSEENGRFGMLGTSPAMQDLYEQIDAAALTDVPVLILGETGAGKELTARAIHAQSARSRGPFVPVNAGALPESLLESELFGHAKGAFTGADAGRDGKLVAASGGTLLLDEMESISERAQIQLLRVLDDGQLQPLGSDKVRRVDVRILATTKTDPAELVRQGKLRKDFYHRVVVLTIAVPPLRERADDIPLLLAHFLRNAANRSGVTVPQVPDSTLSAIMEYSWLGNVRELRNAAERLLISAKDGVAGPFHADEETSGGRLLSLPPGEGLLKQELERTEKTVIEAVLRDKGGEVSAASIALCISRRALYERMKKYGLNRSDYH